MKAVNSFENQLYLAVKAFVPDVHVSDIIINTIGWLEN